MPAQIPREATDFFGSLLLPYIPEMVYDSIGISKTSPVLHFVICVALHSLSLLVLTVLHPRDGM